MLQPTDDVGQSDDEQEQQRQEQERPPQQIIISIIILCISDNKKTDFVIQQIPEEDNLCNHNGELSCQCVVSKLYSTIEDAYKYLCRSGEKSL